MYKAYVDNYPLYDPVNGFNLVSPKVSQELNKVGSFEFTIYPNHPYFNKLLKFKSVITVYDRDMLVFKGRIINDEEGFHNERFIECESDLAYLLDSTQRPYDFQGSLNDLFEQFLTNHNAQVEEAKQFKLGTITVTDTNDYVHYSDTTYLNTFDSIKKKLIETHGGYIFIRHESDGNYLDYVDDFTLLTRQTVEFGKNLLDFKRSTKGEDIKTAVIPLGKKDEETETRLTIESVNDGKDYVYDADAVEQYGWIFETVEYDDVTIAANLKTKGEQYLAEKVLLAGELELSAVDLAALDAEFGSFHLGTYVKCISEPHNLNSNYLVSKIDINLSDPTSNTLSLGRTYTTLTEQNYDSKKEYENMMGNISSVITDIANIQIESEAGSMISQTAEEIYQMVGENYFLKDDAETLIESINTQFSQTKDEFNFTFTEFQQDIQDVINGVDANFTDMTKYIRFVDGNIVIGIEGNPLTLKISNDRISFLENNLEVAYFSDNQLHVTNARVVNRMDMGLFAWYPRSNGNLTLRYFGGDTV